MWKSAIPVAINAAGVPSRLPPCHRLVPSLARMFSMACTSNSKAAITQITQRSPPLSSPAVRPASLDHASPRDSGSRHSGGVYAPFLSPFVLASFLLLSDARNDDSAQRDGWSDASSGIPSLPPSHASDESTHESLGAMIERIFPSLCKIEAVARDGRTYFP